MEVYLQAARLCLASARRPFLRGSTSCATLPTLVMAAAGGGHDALALGSAQRSVVGLDIAPTAIAAADALWKARGSPACVQFMQADFFTADIGVFDLIFDYTFFCALPPAWRPRWAARMAQLLAPGGTLVTLVFPVGTHSGGPPFAVSPEAYSTVLEAAGLRCESLADVPAELSFPGRGGKEMIGKWVHAANSSPAAAL